MDLKIKIPHEFKDQIIHRFSYENRQVNGNSYYIPYSCPLCDKFRNDIDDCYSCPIDNWAGKNKMKYCTDIFENLLNEKPLFEASAHSVKWQLDDDAKVKAQLERLLEIAEQAIEWV